MPEEWFAGSQKTCVKSVKRSLRMRRPPVVGRSARHKGPGCRGFGVAWSIGMCRIGGAAGAKSFVWPGWSRWSRRLTISNRTSPGAA